MALTIFWSFFEYSNGLTFFAVLILLLITLLFVSRNMIFLRIHGAEELMFPTGRNLIDPVRKPIPKIDMMKVHILFSFKLVNLPSSENQNELQCLISSKVDYCIQVIWGVNIRELHINLWHHWKTLKKSFFDDNLLQNSYQFKTMHKTRSAHNDEVVTLKVPDSQIELGLPPRLCYPLVVLLIRNDKEECIHPDETVALVNVIHIKDSICTLPTSILSQYLKQANGQLSCLKQLYLATGNLINYEKEESNSLSLSLAEPLDQATGDFQKAFVCQSEDNKTKTPRKCANIDQLCVVCQSYPLSRALLPCRHTCLCAICFEQLDRCPLCRGSIRSFFCIRNEDYVPKKTDHDSLNRSTTKSSRSIMYWLEHWNETLNDFLGFPR